MQCPPLYWEPVIPLGWEIASSLPVKSNDPTAGLLKSDRFPGTVLEQINLGNCWYVWFSWSYFFLYFSHWVYGAHYHFIWGFPSAWCIQLHCCSVEKPMQNGPVGFVSILELELEGMWPSWCRNELCTSSHCLEGTRAVSKWNLFLINKFSSLSLPTFFCLNFFFNMRKQTREANQITAFIAVGELSSLCFSPDLSWGPWVEPFISWHCSVMAQAGRWHGVLYQLPSEQLAVSNILVNNDDRSLSVELKGLTSSY